MTAELQFYEWLAVNVSQATAKKYHGAIKGVISDWARDAGLITGSILDIRDQSVMANLVLNMKELNIVQDRDDKGHNMYTSALKKYSLFLFYINQVYNEQDDFKSDIEAIINDKVIKATDKLQLISARVGQGKYREDLVGLWGCCSVTGYKDTSLLVASHIKPWASSNDSERIDPYNGFLLLPNIDKVFDKGLISFDKQGKIIISKSIISPSNLGISSEMSIVLDERHTMYLNFHRENVFKK